MCCIPVYSGRRRPTILLYGVGGRTHQPGLVVCLRRRGQNPPSQEFVMCISCSTEFLYISVCLVLSCLSLSVSVCLSVRARSSLGACVNRVHLNQCFGRCWVFFMGVAGGERESPTCFCLCVLFLSKDQNMFSMMVGGVEASICTKEGDLKIFRKGVVNGYYFLSLKLKARAGRVLWHVCVYHMISSTHYIKMMHFPRNCFLGEIPKTTNNPVQPPPRGARADAPSPPPHTYFR